MVQAELAAYSEELSDKPMFIVINKMDLPETQTLLEYVEPQIQHRAERMFRVSAATGEGIQELLEAVSRRLAEIPKVEPARVETARVYSLEDDESAWEAERLSAHHFEVNGTKIERSLLMTDFSLDEGRR